MEVHPQPESYLVIGEDEKVYAKAFLESIQGEELAEELKNLATQ